ncbi:MAG: glycosyltransferase [Anaerolineae bacterium]|nr:glycosyltransferase [Anaerolineae bacterium]
MASVLVIYKEFPASTVRHAGGKAVFRAIEFLHRQGHRVSLVTRVRAAERPLLEQTRYLYERVYDVPHHTALPGSRPLAWVRSYLALRRAARLALREVQPDFVHVEVTQTALTVLGLRRPFTSFRPLDVNWFLLRQQADRARGLRRALLHFASCLLHRVEAFVCHRYDLIATISEGDRRLLAPDCGALPITILPLAPSFAPESDVPPAAPPGANVLFVGAMYRAFNVQGVLWFLDQVWPRVLAQVSDARFYTVGYNPPPEVVSRHDGEHVFVVGFVESLAPWYRAAIVTVSPLLVAGGLLQKVLDAFAMSVPVVATSVSNHGVGATDGEHLLLADAPEAFADAVVMLLRDPVRCARLAEAALRFACEWYDLDAALHRWELLWMAALSEETPGEEL